MARLEGCGQINLVSCTPLDISKDWSLLKEISDRGRSPEADELSNVANDVIALSPTGVTSSLGMPLDAQYADRVVVPSPSSVVLGTSTEDVKYSRCMGVSACNSWALDIQISSHNGLPRLKFTVGASAAFDCVTGARGSIWCRSSMNASLISPGREYVPVRALRTFHRLGRDDQRLSMCHYEIGKKRGKVRERSRIDRFEKKTQLRDCDALKNWYPIWSC